MAVADRISVTASFADIDNDGDPDLFVTTVGMGNLMFENDGNRRVQGHHGGRWLGLCRTFVQRHFLRLQS